jgi:hypothetical protein
MLRGQLTMAADDETLAIVATVTTEVEGQLLANILDERGIPAVVTGGTTSEFRAQAPGAVQVMVKQGSLSAARSALAERAQHRPSPEAVAGEQEFPAYQSRLTAFGIWSLLIGESLAIAGILAYLAMGGDLVGGLATLVVSVGIVAAILTRRRFATH